MSRLAVAIDGQDMAVMVNDGATFSVVESGNLEFLALKTDATPSYIDVGAADQEYNKNYTSLVINDGYSDPIASQLAAIEFADKYGIAFYVGKNGVFHKINP